MRPRNATRAERSDSSALATIAIVGQTRRYRESLAQSFTARRRFIVVDVGEFSPPDLERLCHLGPDVVLLDLAEVNPAARVRDVRRVLPECALIAVNVREDETGLLGLLEAGLTSFVPKEGTLDDIHTCIEESLQGELRCPPRVVAAMARRLSELTHGGASPPRENTLSSRELEVVLLVEQGLTNKEIALRLRIEAATVKNHVHHILEKLSVHHRREAAAQLREDRPKLGVIGGK